MESSAVDKYRVRVRSADGQERISDVFSIVSPTVALALGQPQWSGGQFGHGEKATLQVSGKDLDGRTIKFVIEHQNGANWEPFEEVTAVMKNGTASADIDLHHPAVKAGAAPEDVSPATLRFHCEVVG